MIWLYNCRLCPEENFNNFRKVIKTFILCKLECELSYWHCRVVDAFQFSYEIFVVLFVSCIFYKQFHWVCKNREIFFYLRKVSRNFDTYFPDWLDIWHVAVAKRSKLFKQSFWCLNCKIPQKWWMWDFFTEYNRRGVVLWMTQSKNYLKRSENVSDESIGSSNYLALHHLFAKLNNSKGRLKLEDWKELKKVWKKFCCAGLWVQSVLRIFVCY